MQIGSSVNLDELKQYAQVCRELGITKLKCADVELELTPAIQVFESQEPSKPAEKEEKVNPLTGLTPSQEREWFEG